MHKKQRVPTREPTIATIPNGNIQSLSLHIMIVYNFIIPSGTFRKNVHKERASFTMAGHDFRSIFAYIHFRVNKFPTHSEIRSLTTMD